MPNPPLPSTTLFRQCLKWKSLRWLRAPPAVDTPHCLTVLAFSTLTIIRARPPHSVRPAAMLHHGAWHQNSFAQQRNELISRLQYSSNQALTLRDLPPTHLPCHMLIYSPAQSVCCWQRCWLLLWAYIYMQLLLLVVLVSLVVVVANRANHNRK